MKSAILSVAVLTAAGTIFALPYGPLECDDSCYHKPRPIPTAYSVKAPYQSSTTGYYWFSREDDYHQASTSTDKQPAASHTQISGNWNTISIGPVSVTYPKATSTPNTNGSPTTTTASVGSATDISLLYTSSNDTTGSITLDLTPGCMIKNGIGIGWLPDEGNSGTMANVNAALGAPPGPQACFQGHYSQITSASFYDGSQLTGRMSDIKAANAPLQAAVMPTGIKFSDMTPDLANQVAAAMKQFTDEGVEVWLRFAHEANWYIGPNTGSNGAPMYPGGTTQEFQTMWQTVANAVKGNEMVKMFWTMNNVGDDASQLTAWWPGADYVDVVGIDVYPDPYTTFAKAYQNVYETFAKGYNKPFYIGETGQTGDARTAWLQQLVSPGEGFELYGGFSWFEYDKDGQDFRVATAGNGIAQGVISATS